MNVKRSKPTPNKPKKKIIKKPNLEEWDFRLYFPECALPPRDKMNCGGSYAFACATNLQMRYCMFGGHDFYFSAQDPISCCADDSGCDGGFVDKTWDYMSSTGVVDEDCFPYTSGEGDVEQCITECKNGAPWKKYKAASVEAFWDPEEMMEELTISGPLSTSMDIHEDFLDYQMGVYEYQYGEYLGASAVIILGFSQDFDERYYWICQNNWGENFGMGGYFNIYFGECRIDNDVYAGMPELEKN